MVGSADKVAGFALGALLDGDRDASRVSEQVSREFWNAARACLAEVSRAPDKREALAGLIRKLRPEPRTLDALPEAARLLLQAPSKRSKSRSTRAVDPDLLAMLKRLAARSSETNPA